MSSFFARLRGKPKPKAKRSLHLAGNGPDYDEAHRKGEGGEIQSTRGREAASETSKRVVSLRRYRQKTLKDYQIMLEFRHLKSHAPTGIFLLPSFTDLRTWSGVIFIKSGIYKGGIFRFALQLPKSYPADGACPEVVFTSRIHHPHISASSGTVDLRSHFDKWVAGKHYIVLVLHVLKSIFYPKDFPVKKLTILNSQALEQWKEANRKEKFMRAVSDCVKESIENRYENPDDSTLKFTVPKKQHEALRKHLHRDQTALSAVYSSPNSSHRSLTTGDNVTSLKS